MKETRQLNYLLPNKILDSSFCINKNSLLKENDPIITLLEKDCLTINKNGFIVLDFKEELSGGLRILVAQNKNEKELYKLRIRFGESLSEVYSNIKENNSTNNHSIRDMEITTTALSDQSFGDTGFRFIRIDLLSKEPIKIKKIYAKSYLHTYKSKFKFNFKDKRINEILKVCKHTLDLCIADYIIDGIKRDRLVWIGDMEPEVRAILHLYGNIPQIEKSINIAEKSNPMPCFMYNIPSYSIWYLLIINDVYNYTKDKAFVSRHKDYITSIINIFYECIDSKSNLNFQKAKKCPSKCYFIDWPTSEFNLNERIDANKNLLIYVLRNIKNGFIKEIKELINKVNEMLKKLESKKTNISKTSVFAAFHYLVNKDKESYDVLIKNKESGLSTFMSYFILSAIKDKDINLAINIMKKYYGAMLDLGATTFFENFDINWIKNSNKLDRLPKKGEIDFHGKHGNYCYKGFRHSLCHGWSVGPISFIIENKEKIK